MIKIKEYTIGLLAECFGTCILILIGESSIANYKFTQPSGHSTLPTAIAFGIGVYSGYILLLNKSFLI